MRLLTIVLLLCFNAVFIGLSASIYSFEEIDAGSVAMGKTSFISSEGSITMYRNPALLTLIKKNDFNMGFSFRTSDFNTYIHSYPSNKKYTLKTKNSFKLTNVSISESRKLPNDHILSYALGYALKNNLDIKAESEETNYTEKIDQQGSIAQLSAAMAYQMSPKFSLGVSHHLSFLSKIKVNDDFGSSGMQKYESTYNFNYFNMSFLYQANPYLDLSLGYQSEYSVNIVSDDSGNTNHYDTYRINPEQWSFGMKVKYKNINYSLEYDLPMYLKTSRSYYSFNPGTNGNFLRTGVAYSNDKYTIKGGYFEETVNNYWNHSLKTGFSVGLSMVVSEGAFLDLAYLNEQINAPNFSEPVCAKDSKYFVNLRTKF